MKQQDVQKPAKIRKCDDDDSNENKKDIKPVTPMSPKVNSIQRNKIDIKQEPSTSQSPKAVSSPRTSLSSQSNLQKKQDTKDSLQSFFKERAENFKTKDPKEMRAPSPTIDLTSQTSEEQPAVKKPNYNDAQLDAAMKKYLHVIMPKGKMAEKLKNAAPYNIFLTAVTDSKATHTDPLSVTFMELLDPSLGELESSVQFNFMVEIGWLLAQYTFAKCRHLPLTIFYGSDEPGIVDISKKVPNITAIKVNIPTPIGCHHTKMMFFFYKDQSMRIVISTANLYEEDWHNRVQGMWISDRLPSLPDEISHVNNGESVTHFREDLMRYLMAYNLPKLQPIIARVRRTDFSDVNVFFVGSTPGTHQESGQGIRFGHLRVQELLSKHSAPIDDSCPVIVQASSIGSLGATPSAYLLGEIASSFSRDSAPVGIRKIPTVKLIYPSLNNVLNSHDNIMGGGCLPYDAKINERQLWLKDYLYQWRCSSRDRNRAMPHIKSYCRYSDRGLYWFMLTSANISRSAWGSINKSSKLNKALRINSYEAGVLFCPRIILNKDRFPMTESQQKDDAPIFKLPFDLPPVKYGSDDVPYCTDYLKSYLIKRGKAV
ncbi:probable tyrosyl-DNA phosphodiesterase isoform X2 [Chironomus tepperi]